MHILLQSHLSKNMKTIIFFIIMSTYLTASTTCVRIGEGTVAPLHQQKLSQHDVQTLGVIDFDPSKKETVTSRGYKWFQSYEEAALDKPFFWDICTPPDQHLDTIKKIIGVDPKARMIVEKPICMSYQINELQELLRTFQGQIVVNENYLSSDVTERVLKAAFEQLNLKPLRIVIEMDKNRTADFIKGRYIDPEGAFKYEGTHMMTILQSLLNSMHLKLPSKPTSVLYEDLSPSLPSQGSADIVFQIENLEINLYSSMKGTLKNRFPPYARETIADHETAPRYRVTAIEGLSPDNISTTVVGFYEPLPNHPRSVGEIVVLQNGVLDRSLGTVPDDTMGKHLGRAVDYFCGLTAINPCSYETGISIVQALDSVLPEHK